MSAQLPARKNLKIFPEADWRYRFEWATEVDSELTPIDLTGFTGRWVLFPSNGEPKVEYTSTLNVNGSGVKFWTVSGFIDLILDKLDVEAFKWKQANYRLFVTDPSTKEVEPLLKGSISVVN